MDFNTAKTAKARREFEKDLYKLLNLSVFGKTMENIRKHIDISLQLLGIVSINTNQNLIGFERRCLMIAIEMSRTSITMNKPILSGKLF